MNLNELYFPGSNRSKKKAFRVVCLQQPAIQQDRKRKSSTTTGPTRSSSNSRHESITTTSNWTSFDNNEIVVAITEGRGEATCEIGICAMNTQHPELTLYQISDTNTYIKTLNKVNLLNPSEILVPITFSTSRLVETLKNAFRNVKIIALERSVFSKGSGLQFVKDVCLPMYNPVYIILQHKYYALTAAGALRMYLEIYKRFTCAKETLKVEYNESDYNTMIDVFAADKLELISCALGNTENSMYRKHSSLRGILNHCVTKLGSRMLRSNILQPPNQQAEIEKRLDCVEELHKSPSKHAEIKNILRKLVNFGQVLSLTVLLKSPQQCDERQLNYILQLNAFFDEVEPLKEVMASSTSAFFLQVHNILCCEEFKALDSLFKQFIHEEARPAYGEQAKIARCFAIRSGQSEILDVLRKKYNDHLEEIRNHVAQVSEETGYDFKLGNNVRKSYHLILQLPPRHRSTFNKSSLPPYFCQIDEMATMITMKTIKLLSLTNRLDDTCAEILLVSNSLIYQLLLEVQKCIGRFYEMCEHLAILDVIQSIAQATTAGHKYVRPKFDNFTHVVDGRHPLLDYILDSEAIPNDINVSPENRLHLITGPNGSGKSIYIRQIVLLQIMAQIGCFVPATKATFKLCNRILARIFFEDNMDCDASAFTLEMKEIKYFFNVITDKTLIIIDELCRSTALREGTALAMAICERLLKTPAFIYFTTHYTYITRLQQLYPEIKCWQLQTNEIYETGSKPRLEYTYKVIPGVVTLEAYGLAMARTIWPEIITNDVEKIFKQLDNSLMNTSVDKRIALKINLENELAEMKRNGVCFKFPVYQKCKEYQAKLKALGVDLDFETPDDTGCDAENSKSQGNTFNNVISNTDDDAMQTENEDYAVAKTSLNNFKNTPIKKSTGNENIDISKSKCNSSMLTEFSYIAQHKRQIRVNNSTSHSNKSCPSVVNTTVSTISNNDNYEKHISQEIENVKNSKSDPQSNNDIAEDNFANNSFVSFNGINENSNKSSSNKNNSFSNIFQNGAGVLPELAENSKQLTNNGILTSQLLNENSDGSRNSKNKKKKVCFFEENNKDYFDFNQSNTFFNMDIDENAVDTDQNPMQLFDFPDENNADISFLGCQEMDFPEPPNTNNFLEDKSLSDSLTSSNFMEFIQRAPCSTPLPEQTVTNENTHHDENRMSPCFPIFENDINEAMSVIDQELCDEFPTHLSDNIVNVNSSFTGTKTSKTSDKSKNSDIFSFGANNFPQFNQFPTHLSDNIVNIESSVTGTKTTTEKSKSKNGEAVSLVEMNQNQSITVQNENTTKQNINNTKHNLKLLPTLLWNSHISCEDTTTTTSTEQENFKRPKKFQPPIKKNINQLTKKEIQDSFNKKRISMLQNNNPIDLEAYCNELDNRPTVKQIQTSEVLLTARKMSNGKFAMDVPKQVELKKIKRFQPPVKDCRKFGRDIKFDVTLLSDANSKAFDKMMAIKKTKNG